MVTAFVGQILIVVGLGLMVFGFTSELSKKIELPDGYTANVGKLIFKKGFVDDSGQPVEPIWYLKVTTDGGEDEN